MMKTIQKQFLNPFSQDLHKDKLYNTVSGSLVNDSICESLAMFERNVENVTKNLIENRKTEN